MNDTTKPAHATIEAHPNGLALLRKPFAGHQISKLPKPTKAQTEEVRRDFKQGVRCAVCGGWHHPKVVHLDYVGHAALTDRLLDCDMGWNWRPVARADDGTPALDRDGGMWIELTVCGVTRLGYGHADGKQGGDALKEVIGDALRNAAMRFGAALDLWHKGDLHKVDGPEDDAGASQEPPSQPTQPQRQPTKARPEPPPTADQIAEAQAFLTGSQTLRELAAEWKGLPKQIQAVPIVLQAKDDRKAQLQPPKDGLQELLNDEVPY